MAGDIGTEEQVIIVSSQNRERASAVAQKAKQEGVRIIHRYGGTVMIAEVPEHRAEQLRASLGTDAAVSAVPHELPSLAKDLDPTGALGLAAFSLRASPAYIAAKEQRPHNKTPWDMGGQLLPPDPPPQLRHLVASPAANGKRVALEAVGTTSLQMASNIAVGIIIVSGPTPDLQFSTQEIQKVIAEVQNGLGWHAAQTPAANITWHYDIHPVQVDAQPGSGPDKEAVWRDPAMAKLGYQPDWQGVYDYIDHIKAQYNTQWTYVGYFTKYPLDWFAYASIGGPRLVMQYSNDGWGPDNIDRVFAHETGHIFQAPDEYSASNCNCGGSWGIYNKPNGNCQLCATGVDCIMRSNSWEYCEWTPWHYGQFRQFKINYNTTASAPFVTPDGWVWFRGTDNTLWKVFQDGSQQSNPGKNGTSASPFVAGDWVYFRGTDSALWRMKTDGSAQNVINKNTTASTPFVTPDGWVWFQGTDNTLWKVFQDGSQQSNPGKNSTASSPFVVGDWVYFRGTDNALWRMKTDGSTQNVINKNTTASTPFVTPDGWVWFQGTDGTLWKVFQDGTQQSNPGKNTTSASPFVAGDWVYFRGSDSALWRMKTDGSIQSVLNNNSTRSTPIASGDWVYFQGTDNTLWACPITFTFVPA